MMKSTIHNEIDRGRDPVQMRLPGDGILKVLKHRSQGIKNSR